MGWQGAKENFKTLINAYKLTFDHSNGTIELPYTVKAASATLTRSDSGNVITTYGATAAVTITLPTPVFKGWWCLIVNAVDQNLTVTAGTADTLITHNNAGADSVDFDQTNNKIGQAVLVISDGNAYHALQVTAGTFGVNDA
jgi:hypothetical protein